MLRLKCDFYASTLKKTENRKCHALARACIYMNLNRKRSITSTSIRSQFSCSPFVWMVQSRGINKAIDKINKKDFTDFSTEMENLSIGKLIIKDKFVTIHLKNLQILTTICFEATSKLTPEIVTGG